LALVLHEERDPLKWHAHTHALAEPPLSALLAANSTALLIVKQPPLLFHVFLLAFLRHLQGELTVLLREGRDLPVWGMPWQSNPWVRLVLGEQAVASRRDSETSTASRHGAPVWNQEVQFLVEDPDKQVSSLYLQTNSLSRSVHKAFS
jgi:hypothetical protein